MIGVCEAGGIGQRQKSGGILYNEEAGAVTEAVTAQQQQLQEAITAVQEQLQKPLLSSMLC